MLVQVREILPLPDMEEAVVQGKGPAPGLRISKISHGKVIDDMQWLAIT